jgi:hypothetical protein
MYNTRIPLFESYPRPKECICIAHLSCLLPNLTAFVHCKKYSGNFPYLNPTLPSTAHWKCNYSVYNKYLPVPTVGVFLLTLLLNLKNPVIDFLIEIICKSAVLLDYLLVSASDMASL